MDLSPHLHPTRDLLLRSLPTHDREQAPPMPTGLAEELMARFESQPTQAFEVRPESFFSKLRGFLATPGFGLAAVAVAVVGLAVPMISGPDKDTFRGGQLSGPITNAPAAVCFVGQNPALQALIEKSGLDASAFRSAATPSSAREMPGAKVIVDFTGGTITALAANGDTVLSVPIPEDNDRVASMVADAVSRL